MRIKIQSLLLQNFKGIKSKLINFGDITDISGDNATGKTTIADAFYWLLFDKDSQERSKFEIKTLDEKGEAIHGLEHVVEGIFAVDQSVLTLKKVYKENWRTPKGRPDKVLDGHTTDYFINEVPVKKNEYTAKISELIDEGLFKLLANPFYFTSLNWKDQREYLMAFVGEMDDEAIIGSVESLKPLMDLLDGKEVDDFKKMIAARRKKLNDELKTIPVRITELHNQIQEHDFGSIEKEIDESKKELEIINEKIADKSKVSEDDLKRKEQIYKYKDRMNEIRREVKAKLDEVMNEWQTKIMDLKNELYQEKKKSEYLWRDKNDIEMKIETYNKRRNSLLETWEEVSAEEFAFDESLAMCPTCKRPFESDAVEEKRDHLKKNFMEDKKRRLDEIQKDGKSVKANLEKLDQDLQITNEKIRSADKNIADLQNSIDQWDKEKPKVDLEKKLANHAEYQRLAASIEEEEKPKDLVAMADDGGLKIKKQDLENKIDSLRSKLAYRDQNDRLKKRIQELTEQEREYANQIAELEGQEFMCEEFTRRKIDMMESEINDRFEVVNFKLFNEQINGGLVETCEAMIGGVPYSSANRAAQINAGLDIIRTLSNHYDYQVPVFLDNREAANRIVKLDTQIINLWVTKEPGLNVEVS